MEIDNAAVIKHRMRNVSKPQHGGRLGEGKAKEGKELDVGDGKSKIRRRSVISLDAFVPLTRSPASEKPLYPRILTPGTWEKNFEAR